MAGVKPRVVTYVFKPHVGAMWGGERSCTVLATHLREHEPIVVVNRDDVFAERLRNLGVEVHVLPTGDPFTGFRAASWGERARRVVAWARHNVALRRTLRQLDPAVIHANDLREVVMAAPALLSLRRPLVTHVRGEMRMRVFHQAVLALSTRSISVSEGLLAGHLAKVHTRLRNRITRRARVVYNGVEFGSESPDRDAPERAVIRSGLGVGEDEVLLLVVGTLEAAKGQLGLVRHVLPRVAADVGRLRVLIVGGDRAGAVASLDGGHYRRAVSTAIDQAELQDRVSLLGVRSDLAELYAAADVVAQPSMSEGLGRVAIEAAGASRPIVAFDLPGINETVRDRETGHLVPPGDHSAFAAALAELCADPTTRRRMGRAAASFARERFDPDVTAARTEAVFREARGVPAALPRPEQVAHHREPRRPTASGAR